ncbi:MAG: PLP-dependent aminotransferase family protein [Chloroflexi bacterium]|nr:PLP-dependent aminotransferase family protein [Chloroflexota bacterium]
MNLEASPQGVVAGSIPLFAGHPSVDLLPIDGIRKTVESVWPGQGITRLFNYGDEQGNRELIDFLVERLKREEKLDISRENLMIVGGSTWGVDMICDQLTQAGDIVLVDAPSYRDALHIFRDHRLDLRDVPIDEGGIVIAELERTLAELESAGRAPKFYYVVPNFQNPSGITMPEDRRLAVIDLSRRYGFVIVEDDVYSDIRFEGELPPSFFAMGGGDNVLRIGTFSKTLAPGLRIGWLIGPAERIAGFVGGGVLTMGGGANPFTAAIVAQYCLSGAWEAHVRWLRGQYRERRDTALRALESAMPAGATYTRPKGGYFIWLRLPRSARVDDLATRARAENVYFAPGTGFFVEPEDGLHHLRLSFSFVPLDDLRAGITILGELISEMSRSGS